MAHRRRRSRSQSLGDPVRWRTAVGQTGLDGDPCRGRPRRHRKRGSGSLGDFSSGVLCRGSALPRAPIPPGSCRSCRDVEFVAIRSQSTRPLPDDTFAEPYSACLQHGSAPWRCHAEDAAGSVPAREGAGVAGMGHETQRLAADAEPLFASGGHRPRRAAPSAVIRVCTLTGLLIPSVQDVLAPVENRSPLGLPRIRS